MRLRPYWLLLSGKNSTILTAFWESSSIVSTCLALCIVFRFLRRMIPVLWSLGLLLAEPAAIVWQPSNRVHSAKFWVLQSVSWRCLELLLTNWAATTHPLCSIRGACSGLIVHLFCFIMQDWCCFLDRKGFVVVEVHLRCFKAPSLRIIIMFSSCWALHEAWLSLEVAPLFVQAQSPA